MCLAGCLHGVAGDRVRLEAPFLSSADGLGYACAVVLCLCLCVCVIGVLFVYDTSLCCCLFSKLLSWIAVQNRGKSGNHKLFQNLF